jgi:hypothetical protein
MKAWRLKIESWRVYRPVVTDSYNFEEELDSDPHLSKKLDPNRDRQRSDADPKQRLVLVRYRILIIKFESAMQVPYRKVPIFRTPF